MRTQTRSFIGVGLLGLALAFSLVGCGGGSSAPAEDPAPQEEAAPESEATAESEAPEAPAEPELAEGLTLHENDLLSIGIAEGWSVPAGIEEVERFEYDDSSGYSFTLDNEDESIDRRSFIVSVYDEATYEWASDELPAESDHAKNIEAIGPVTINGVEFKGYRSDNTSLDGTPYHYMMLCGVVDGHYVEIIGTDGSADGVLFEDQMLMAGSITLK